MRKPTGGAPRLLARLRPSPHRAPTASRFHRRSIDAAKGLRLRLRTRRPTPVGAILQLLVARLRVVGSAERAVPVAVALIVAIASMLSVLPATSHGAVGGTTGNGSAVRIAVGGGLEGVGAVDQPIYDGAGTDPIDDTGVPGGAGGPGGSFQPVTIPGGDVPETPAVSGPLLDDGTLLTGVAPETNVADGADLIRHYRVKAGDTLTGIAHKFGVSMMSVWWANDLKSKDDLHIGQQLRIPPVSGVVVEVTAADTLESLAAKYRVDPAVIIETNGLEDPNLIVGQTLVLPGALGEGIATPRPTPRPSSRPSAGGGGGGSVRPPTHYGGGRFAWPVIGGNNYISQYFHYGHYAIDIAADYGSKVVAAAGGRVIFAGWKSNGGGYQVWIAHGSNLYTTYNHMSAVSVGTGQSVSRGQQVGRIGATGNATGPHLHFEVWIGPVWNGGTRVNPLRYY